MKLRLEWRPAARRELHKLPPEIQEHIASALARLAETRQGDLVKLRGVDPPQYRLRVSDYRIRLSMTGEAVVILRVAHRREVYR